MPNKEKKYWTQIVYKTIPIVSCRKPYLFLTKLFSE